MKIEKYNKMSDISFSMGAYPTYELLKNKSDYALCVYIHSKAIFTDELNRLVAMCKTKNIEIIHDDKVINKISDKENCFVLGVFKKYNSTLIDNKQIVLSNPSDMGNLGTIMRTIVGFGYTDLVIIKPAVDYFNPKVVRASMGAIFMLNIVEFDSMDEYLASNSYQKYLFMLGGNTLLGEFKTPKDNYSLIFGNEAHGIDKKYAKSGTSVLIKHSDKIDSLNLPISVGMTVYEFNKK